MVCQGSVENKNLVLILSFDTNIWEKQLSILSDIFIL